MILKNKEDNRKSVTLVSLGFLLGLVMYFSYFAAGSVFDQYGSGFNNAGAQFQHKNSEAQKT